MGIVEVGCGGREAGQVEGLALVNDTYVPHGVPFVLIYFQEPYFVLSSFLLYCSPAASLCYVYSVWGKLCVGVVLWDSKQEASKFPTNKTSVQRLNGFVSNVVSFLTLSHAIDHVLCSFLYEYVCTWKIFRPLFFLV